MRIDLLLTISSSLLAHILFLNELAFLSNVGRLRSAFEVIVAVVDFLLIMADPLVVQN